MPKRPTFVRELAPGLCWGQPNILGVSMGVIAEEIGYGDSLLHLVFDGCWEWQAMTGSYSFKKFCSAVRDREWFLELRQLEEIAMRLRETKNYIRPGR